MAPKAQRSERPGGPVAPLDHVFAESIAGCPAKCNRGASTMDLPRGPCRSARVRSFLQAHAEFGASSRLTPSRSARRPAHSTSLGARMLVNSSRAARRSRPRGGDGPARVLVLDVRRAQPADGVGLRHGVGRQVDRALAGGDRGFGLSHDRVDPALGPRRVRLHPHLARGLPERAHALQDLQRRHEVPDVEKVQREYAEGLAEPPALVAPLQQGHREKERFAGADGIGGIIEQMLGLDHDDRRR